MLCKLLWTRDTSACFIYAEVTSFNYKRPALIAVLIRSVSSFSWFMKHALCAAFALVNLYMHRKRLAPLGA